MNRLWLASIWYRALGKAPSDAIDESPSLQPDARDRRDSATDAVITPKNTSAISLRSFGFMTRGLPILDSSGTPKAAQLDKRLQARKTGPQLPAGVSADGSCR